MKRPKQRRLAPGKRRLGKFRWPEVGLSEFKRPLEPGTGGHEWIDDDPERALQRGEGRLRASVNVD